MNLKRVQSTSSIEESEMIGELIDFMKKRPKGEGFSANALWLFIWLHVGGQFFFMTFSLAGLLIGTVKALLKYKF